jgi:hypothetical protein
LSKSTDHRNSRCASLVGGDNTLLRVLDSCLKRHR